MPSAATIISATAAVALFFVYLAWSETTGRYEMWDELSTTPWSNHDVWQARLDRMQDSDRALNLAVTVAFVATSGTALLACALRKRLARVTA